MTKTANAARPAENSPVFVSALIEAVEGEERVIAALVEARRAGDSTRVNELLSELVQLCETAPRSSAAQDLRHADA